MDILIKNARIVNEGETFESDLLIKNRRIHKLSTTISAKNYKIIDLNGNYLMPGVIDDQVHFREPGLTHKANIFSESRAAVAGGITSFMEMPNTNPPVLSQELLQQKFDIAKHNSLANYSFFMGVSNTNINEVLKTDFGRVPGLKIFMGSSTGNMLVDDFTVLNNIFSNVEGLIAVHCEDENTIKENIIKYKTKFGENVPIEYHPNIRSEEACYKSSALAVSLAKKYSTRLHVLHISTERELDLFSNDIDLKQKKITSEACIHHLTFTDKDYKKRGAFIKWNPAVKSEKDNDAIWKALLDNRIDVIATDHAPHTAKEKRQSYFNCPSGAPMVQHALTVMLQHHLNNKISVEKIVEKMCHAPAICFNIEKRGFIREGFYADLVAIERKSWEVKKDNLMYMCGWSPLENKKFDFNISHTFVNGNLVYENGMINDSILGVELSYL